MAKAKAKKKESNKTAIYAVVKVDVCGDVCAPGEYMVVTLTDEFFERMFTAHDLMKKHNFTEIESDVTPTYAFINDLEWLSMDALKALSDNRAVIVRTEPTVFFNLADDYEDDTGSYEIGSTVVNFIPRGFQIVERMNNGACGEEIYGDIRIIDRTAIEV